MFTVGNSNGLMASSATHRGLQTTRPFYLVDEGNGDAIVDGDLTVKGDIRADGNIYTADRVIYPGAVKITTAGSISKQGSATVVPESAFTIPTGLDGYYSFTAQVSLGGVGTVGTADIMTTYLDVSGGSLTPINGTIVITNVAENSGDQIYLLLSGIIMQRLTAGQVIQLYHSEVGTYTFTGGSIQVAYTYLGDTAL